MVNRIKILLLCLSIAACASRKVQPVVLEKGVSRALAVYRKSVVSAVRYQLELEVPQLSIQPVRAYEQVSFMLSAARLPLQLDFKEDPAKILTLTLNGHVLVPDLRQEHLVLPAELLKKGQNQVTIHFIAGNGALNRSADYLYTLFVPDRARTVFPCFDQPDLKAIYTLTLHLPAGWKALANAGLKDSLSTAGKTGGDQLVKAGAKARTYHFKPSDLLSTYLFAFAAGNFKLYSGNLQHQETDFLYRETDPAKIKSSTSAIYDIHHQSLAYYERWTGIPYPFQKFGFVAIPDFQFGGMEHPGAIQYKASTLFLDEGATRDQLNARNNLIAHETAHMWFGDLVTMDWFSDVWMKEVFANFMADKSTGDDSATENYKLKFLIDHLPAAYAVDRTAGANPIRQPLENLKDAGTLYGNIIYHKAPVMMQQLEGLMGKSAFQQGVRAYLHKFARSNASWPDLIAILDRYTVADLQQWNKVWVNDSGRPVIDYTVTYLDNKIERLELSQHPENGPLRIWPQTFEISLFYPDSVKVVKADLRGEKLQLKAAEGLDRPLFMLFNSSGEGYGRWPVDSLLAGHLFSLEKPLYRASAYISLYEQMLSGQGMSPAELLELFTGGLDKEQEELNIKLLTGYISNLYWQFSTPVQRQQISARLEDRLWTSLNVQKSMNMKKLLFKAYQDTYLSASARSRLYRIWKYQQAPAGVALSEDDYTSLALSLALRDDSDPTILAVQEGRITNADRKLRFHFIRPAVAADGRSRDEFFDSLRLPANRSKEANVLAALYYLHHPLRQKTSIQYLRRSLDLLEEIQNTGDIFFPQSWLQATLGSYQSAEAAAVVQDFLKEHPGYPSRLKAKILQNADNLFRAQLLLR